MSHFFKRHLNLPSFLSGCVLVAASCLLFYSFGNQKPAFFKTMDYQVMDMMFKIRGPVPDSGQVVIVDIDEKSLQQFGQWPWPRNILTELTRNLYQSGARAVGFDILFAEKDRASPLYFFESLDPSIREKLPTRVWSHIMADETLDYDSLFAQVLSQGPSVLGYAFQMKNDGLKSEADVPFPSSIIQVRPDTVGFPELSLIPAYRAIINHPSVAAAQSEGFFNVFEDSAGTTRQVPLLMKMDNIPYPSLALETYRIGMSSPPMTIRASTRIKTPGTAILGLQIGSRFIPTDSHGQLFLNCRGPSGTFRYVSASKVLSTPGLPDLKNKFILVGSSATGLFDLKTTPMSNVIPGTEINANIIDNLIQSDPFTYDIYTEIGLNYTLLIAGGLFISLLLSVSGPLAGSAGAVLFLLSAMTLNYWHFFLNTRFVGITYPLLVCIVILFIISIFNAVRERRTKQFIKKAFSHYVSPEVVSHLIKHPDTLSLKGEERELSVLFCDIRGFTTLSENMTPRDLGNFMNEFLSKVSQVIIRNDGTVDKFIGDAIMAFWGAPRKDPDHALKAVSAAMELKKELKNFNFSPNSAAPEGIRVGIGINSGQVSVGNFGSRERFDYTVMGDNVNLASRLEGANKNYGTTILISSTTRNFIKPSFFCRYIDKVIVKGRRKPVDIYEPILAGEPAPDLLKEITTFETAVKAYQEREFEKALHLIKGLNQNPPSRLYQTYLDRIEGFLTSPPPEQWNGAERRSLLPASRLKTK